MSIKLKALGLGLLAAMAMGAIAVVNASATSSGHFTAEPATHHVIIKGEESGTTDRLAFYAIENNATHTTTEPNNPIECTKATYHGTLEGAAATTTTAVRVRPHYTECRTRSEASHKVVVDIDPNNTGCGTNVFEFTSGGTGTVHVNCTITITHPNCSITIDPQTTSGVTYTTTTESNKHALTINVNAKTISGTYHNGICVFLGTSNHFFEMVGAARVWGEDTAANRVGITHTP